MQTDGREGGGGGGGGGRERGRDVQMRAELAGRQATASASNGYRVRRHRMILKETSARLSVCLSVCHTHLALLAPNERAMHFSCARLLLTQREEGAVSHYSYTYLLEDGSWE